MSLNYYDLNATSIENRFAGSVHGHAIEDVTGLRTELDSVQSGLTSTSDIVFHDAIIYGDFTPDTNGTQVLGTATKHFKEAWIDELHLAESTLYLGDTPVIGTNQSTVEVKADIDQGITIKTVGTGETKMISQNGIEISNSGLNGQVSIQATGAGGQVSFGAVQQLNFTAPSSIVTGDLNVSGTSSFGAATFSGDVTFNGTNYLVNTTQVSTSDNRITLNAGEVGAGVTSGYSGFEVDRGTLTNWQFVFDEVTDTFVFGEIGGTLKKIIDKSYVDTALNDKLDISTFNTTYTAADVLTKIKTVDGAGSGLDADTLDGYQAADLLLNANQILDAVKSVDGAGSGLDADLLDGHDSSYFESSTYMISTDDRAIRPNNAFNNGTKLVKSYFTSLNGLNAAADNDYQDMILLDTYSDNTGGKVNALTFDKSEQIIRHWQANQSDTVWGESRTLEYKEVWIDIWATYTAKEGDRIFVDTVTSAFTITLPANPAIGDTIEFIDGPGNFQNNNLTISRNGKHIMGSSTDLIADVEDARFKMTYSGALEGWKVN